VPREGRRGRRHNQERRCFLPVHCGQHTGTSRLGNADFPRGRLPHTTDGLGRDDGRSKVGAGNEPRACGSGRVRLRRTQEYPLRSECLRMNRQIHSYELLLHMQQKFVLVHGPDARFRNRGGSPCGPRWPTTHEHQRLPGKFSLVRRPSRGLIGARRSFALPNQPHLEG
jgi:hypothetical protein